MWKYDIQLNLVLNITYCAKFIFICVFLCISGVSACTLTCLVSGNVVRTYSNVADGTRCDHQNPFVYDVCINGRCQVLLNSRLHFLYPTASFDTTFWPQATSIFVFWSSFFLCVCMCVFHFLELRNFGSVYINLVHIRCSYSGKLRSESRGGEW